MPEIQWSEKLKKEFYQLTTYQTSPDFSWATIDLDRGRVSWAVQVIAKTISQTRTRVADGKYRTYVYTVPEQKRYYLWRDNNWNRIEPCHRWKDRKSSKLIKQKEVK
jgi:hypothetical protein